MNKKYIIYIIFILILSQLSLAAIIIEPLSYNKYNLGEIIDLKGSISTNIDVEGFLSTKIKCGTDIIPIDIQPLTISSTQILKFPDDIEIKTIRATQLMEGDCNLIMEIIHLGTTIEQTESMPFKISNQLYGNFHIEEKKIQKGENIFITGEIEKINLDTFSGIITIHFNLNGEKQFTKTINTDTRNFEFNHPSILLVPGKYTLDFEVRDLYNNNELFKDAISFNISNEIKVTTRTTLQNIKPEQKFSIYGEIKSIRNQDIKKGELKILFDQEEYELEFKDGGYLKELTVPANIKTGQHTIKVQAIDNNGNQGTENININIIPVAKKLTNQLNKEVLKPNEELIIHPLLYDQGNDLMNTELTLEIQDTNNQLIYTSKIMSNEDYSYIMPKYAIPGEWKVYTYVNEKTIAKEIFTIEKIFELQLSYEGTNVFIKNIGNTNYDKDIFIKLSSKSKDHTITHKKSIKPNETLIIDLSNELPSGIYSGEIVSDNNYLKIDYMNIKNGKKGLSYEWKVFLWSLAILLIIVIIFIKRKQKKTRMTKREKKILKKINFKKKKKIK